MLEPAHLREAVAQELADTAHRYVEDPLTPPDLKGRAKEKILEEIHKKKKGRGGQNEGS